MSKPKYLTLSDAARIVPGRPCSKTLWRWARRGLTARTGRKVHLRHVRIGGRVYTTAEWLETFYEQLAEADLEHHALPDEHKLVIPSHAQADAMLSAKGL